MTTWPASPSVTNPAAQLANQGDSVVALHTTDLADRGAGIGIEHFHFRAVREVNTAGRGIEGDVIEIFAAALRGAESDPFQQTITVPGRRSEDGRAEEKNARGSSQQGKITALHDTST